MNKLVKGSIAGAAGIALLLGGSATLAVWSDGATINPGSITSGELDLTPNADGEWDPEIDFIVPGDSTTYTETFEISAVGDNLQAEITTNIAAITGTITGATYDVEFTVLDGATPVVPVAGVYDLSEGTYDVSVEIEVDFPSTATAGMNQSIDFDALQVTVSQVV